MAAPYWVPYRPESAVFVETLHGRLKKRLQPSENDRVLKNGLSSSKPDYYSHSGPQGAEGGHHEEVGLGLAKTQLIAFYKHF